MALKYRLVMFDFDGTLADSYPWFLRIFDQLADRYRFKRLDPGATEMLRGLDARQIMRLHQVPAWKVPFIARHARTLLSKHVAEIALFAGVPAALRALQEHGAHLALVTSNSRANVDMILGPENLARIGQLECGISVFGKASRLRRVLARRGCPPQQAIFIGDEIRDAQAARRAGIAFGAVAWGYTRLDALAAHDPRETFTRVEDLANHLRSP
jgi:phosphoglycolate phosphatase